MAAVMPTILDIAKATGNDLVVGLVDEAARFHPEAQYGYARTIKGTQYKTLVRTSNPTASFRNYNEGSDAVKSTTENRLVECFLLNPRWECDKALADSHEDGRDVLIAMEAAAQYEAALALICQQMYYGRNTLQTSLQDSKGFPGLVGSVDSSMVVDAGGTTDDAASSIYFVNWGVQKAGWVWGNDGAMEPSELMTARITDANSKPFTAYIQEIISHVGLQVLDKFSVARIKKVTADSGKGATDALLGKALALFPVGKEPNMILMSRRSREQVRASRTATNATGTPAPTPIDFQNIPIYATDAIVDTEKLAL